LTPRAVLGNVAVVDHDDAVGPLVRLGLTSYEARAFIALMGRDSFSAAEVARRAGLPRQRVYDVLGGLVEKGLAATRPGDVLKYAAAEPAHALERLVGAHRQALLELEQEAGLIVEELTPNFLEGQTKTDPIQYIEVLRSAGATIARFDELEAAVKKEILVFSRPPYADHALATMEDTGVAWTRGARSLYEFSLFADRELTGGAHRIIQAGHQARFVPELPLTLVIMDETTVMFGMKDQVAGTSDMTMVVVEHPSLATMLKVAFESYWERGLNFEEAQRQALDGRAQSA
jgi:sugar-specific transcriptional regulator TrmB